MRAGIKLQKFSEAPNAKERLLAVSAIHAQAWTQLRK